MNTGFFGDEPRSRKLPYLGWLVLFAKLPYLSLYYSLGWTSSQDYTLARDR
jgi:hypothetical protein